MEKNATLADMKTLADCINHLVQKGFTENFQVGENGLLYAHEEKSYMPGQVHVKDFYRFEGASDPADNSILYAIETNDGMRGTLTDAYGPYADPKVSKFMDQVDDIHKKTESNDRGTS